MAVQLPDFDLSRSTISMIASSDCYAFSPSPTHHVELSEVVSSFDTLTQSLVVLTGMLDGKMQHTLALLSQNPSNPKYAKAVERTQHHVAKAYRRIASDLDVMAIKIKAYAESPGGVDAEPIRIYLASVAQSRRDDALDLETTATRDFTDSAQITAAMENNRVKSQATKEFKRILAEVGDQYRSVLRQWREKST